MPLAITSEEGSSTNICTVPLATTSEEGSSTNICTMPLAKKGAPLTFALCL